MSYECAPRGGRGAPKDLGDLTPVARWATDAEILELVMTPRRSRATSALDPLLLEVHPFAA